jgi:predicted transcriptional regulator
MKRTTVRVGTAREFFERGQNYAQRLCMGTRLPESRLITFEDPADMMRVLSPAKLQLLRAVKAHPGSIGSLASRLRRDRSAVTREVAQLQRFGLVRVADEVLPGHGRMKKVSAVAGEIRLEAIIA